MSEESDKRLPGAGSALVRTAQEAAALARRQHEKPPDEEVYWCSVCGFSPDGDVNNVRYPRGLTLKFGPDEIEALGGDLRNYTGPCPICKSETLVPYGDFFGMESAFSMSRAQKREDYKEQANVLIDRVKEELAGGIFTGAGAGAVPGDDSELPDAASIDTSDLKPR